MHPAAAFLKIPAEIPAWHKFCHTEHFWWLVWCWPWEGWDGLGWPDGTGSAGQAGHPRAGSQCIVIMLCIFRALLGECHCRLCCFHVDQKTVTLWRGENRALSANCTSGKCLSNHLLFQYHPGLEAVLKLYSSTALNVGFCLFSVALLYCLSALLSAFESYLCIPWIIIPLCNISVVWTPQKLLQQGHFVELSAG